MAAFGSHRGIQYELTEVRSGEWRWSFRPPTGATRTGRVIGDQAWARTVVRRAIEVWHLMNDADRPQPAVLTQRGWGPAAPVTTSPTGAASRP
jgi:hypothetical protein